MCASSEKHQEVGKELQESSKSAPSSPPTSTARRNRGWRRPRFLPNPYLFGRRAGTGSTTLPRIRPTKRDVHVLGVLVLGAALVLSSCTSSGSLHSLPTTSTVPAKKAPAGVVNVYAATGANRLTGAARQARPLIYVPESLSDYVDVIDPSTYRVIDRYRTGGRPQHVVPSWDLRTLYAANNLGNSLTPIDPTTGKIAGPNIPVADPYNLYFTPDGTTAIVVAEHLSRLDFRDPHTFALRKSVSVNCAGIDHLDFAADGSYLIASCEYAGRLVKIDLPSRRIAGYLDLPGSSPQDVKLEPAGKVFYVADMKLGGVHLIDGATFRAVGFICMSRIGAVLQSASSTSPRGRSSRRGITRERAPTWAASPRTAASSGSPGAITRRSMPSRRSTVI